MMMMLRAFALAAVAACLTLSCELAGPGPRAQVPQIGIVAVNNDAAPLRLSITTTAVGLIGTAADIGDCTGVLPIEVKVEPGGEPFWEAPGVLC